MKHFVTALIVVLFVIMLIVLWKRADAFLF